VVTTAPRPAARRLSGGEKALIAVVTVLVIVFLVLLAQRPGAAPPADEAATAGAGPGGSASPSATVNPVLDLESQGYSFQLPSGNIGCAMSASGVLCAIRSFDYPPPDLPGCDADTGVAFELDADGTSAACTTGTPDFGDVAVLPYGESTTVGEFTCESSEQGVSCSNAAGQEFSVRRSDYNL